MEEEVDSVVDIASYAGGRGPRIQFDVDEPGVGEDRFESRRVPERERAGSGGVSPERYIHESPSDLKGARCPRVLHGGLPTDKTEPPPGAQRGHKVGECGCRVREEHDPETGVDPVGITFEGLHHGIAHREGHVCHPLFGCIVAGTPDHGRAYVEALNTSAVADLGCDLQCR